MTFLPNRWIQNATGEPWKRGGGGEERGDWERKSVNVRWGDEGWENEKRGETRIHEIQEGQEGTEDSPGGNRGKKARKRAQLCLLHPPMSVSGGLHLPQVWFSMHWRVAALPEAMCVQMCRWLQVENGYKTLQVSSKNHVCVREHDFPTQAYYQHVLMVVINLDYDSMSVFECWRQQALFWLTEILQVRISLLCQVMIIYKMMGSTVIYKSLLSVRFQCWVKLTLEVKEKYFKMPEHARDADSGVDNS